MRLLKFYTETCCQCKLLSKELEGFDMVPVEPIDCEENHDDLIAKFQIKSIPTLILVDKSGDFLRKITGHITREEVETIVKSELVNE